MGLFLWFALFRERTESRLSFLSFFYGKTHLNFYLLAYFNETPPFVLLFVYCFFFYGKVQVEDDSVLAYFNEIPPFIVFLLCS